ncbi:MAG: hypothetical protein H6716_23640 [Polyangiaceae bacterium]|nr:hypothetical protein [Polyangiaceae bacterium]
MRDIYNPAKIYEQLLEQLQLRKAITYKVFCEDMAAPGYHRTFGFHAALGDVVRVCSSRKLPPLPAIVIRAGDGLPGAGYFTVAHPNAKREEWRRLWKVDLERVMGHSEYPELVRFE